MGNLVGGSCAGALALGMIWCFCSQERGVIVARREPGQ